ncbi:LysR family transcriptional regulator [Sphingomonas jatrophae]|uniref:DNA-binding transcriptional regulator, LysR family n=1 Tax=Sphingomonas jatrophae TaxID=1166337 RepID=A0A1I6JGQ6_9SPHN|nr:LysR family transcriptional regulator [Sphingomonas jatrophae]SFR78143.1 DNA-binding transcriptional regulator, LysR family [Sphingomonas jatrophae]
MPHLPDLEAWAVFARVAEQSSFAGAARTLGLSKATVSKAVARLEARLGTPLIHRTSRRLALTDAGRLALEPAQRMLAAGEAAEDSLADCGERPRGQVRLAAPMSFGIAHLGPVLAEFLAEYPDISVDLRLSDARTDLIGEGIDLALRIGVLEDSSLKARRLFTVRAPLVAAPSWIERHGRPAHPRDLERCPAIIYTHVAQPTRWRFLHPDEGEAVIEVSGRMRVDNGDVVMPALLAGIGMARQPEFLAWEALRDGRLEELLPEWSFPVPGGLHLVSPPGSIRPARVQALAEWLAKAFLRKPWAYAEGPE